MADVWANGNKLMLLGLELGIVAIFGLVSFNSVTIEVWTFVLLASVFLTIVGLLDDPPE